jgi:hypothetical protein
METEEVYDDQGQPLGPKRRFKVRFGEVGEDGRCGDCGAKPGHCHHPGCDLEKCVVCHGQALGCLHYFDAESREQLITEGHPKAQGELLGHKF